VDDLRPALGRRVRSLRQRLGLSQEGIAERAETHWTFISGIERGIRNPGLNMLGRLARALEVSLPELVAGLEGTRTRHRSDSTAQKQRRR
jgi:transcriptional regulator with XRE-family HTH domain